jgi:hypothetical protein
VNPVDVKLVVTKSHVPSESRECFRFRIFFELSLLNLLSDNRSLITCRRAPNLLLADLAGLCLLTSASEINRFELGSDLEMVPAAL